MKERKKLAGLAILLVMILLLQSLLFRVTNIYYIFPLLDLIVIYHCAAYARTQIPISIIFIYGLIQDILTTGIEGLSSFSLMVIYILIRNLKTKLHSHKRKEII